MPCPSHPPSLEHSNYAWRREQVMKNFYITRHNFPKDILLNVVTNSAAEPRYNSAHSLSISGSKWPLNMVKHWPEHSDRGVWIPAMAFRESLARLWCTAYEIVCPTAFQTLSSASSFRTSSLNKRVILLRTTTTRQITVTQSHTLRSIFCGTAYGRDSVKLISHQVTYIQPHYMDPYISRIVLLGVVANIFTGSCRLSDTNGRPCLVAVTYSVPHFTASDYRVTRKTAVQLSGFIFWPTNWKLENDI
jgi:hypothetical protein